MSRPEIVGRPQVNQLFGANALIPATLDSDIRPTFDLYGVQPPCSTNNALVTWGAGSAANTPTNSNGALFRSGLAPNVGDWAEWKFPLPRRDPVFTGFGMYIVAYKYLNCGQMIVRINGTQVQMYDLYSAALVQGFGHFTDLNSLGVIDFTKATLNTLRLEVATKNASSSGQFINLITLGIYPII